jgi:hypothetical protein
MSTFNRKRQINKAIAELEQRTWVGLTDEERSQLVTLCHGWNEHFLKSLSAWSGLTVEKAQEILNDPRYIHPPQRTLEKNT